MLIAESQSARRLIGRFDRGVELCAALKLFCREHGVCSGELRASGLLTSVELVSYDRGAKGYGEPRRMRGPFELLHLWGTIAVCDGDLALSLRATLARDDREHGGGIDLVGGLLVAAEVVALEVVVDSFEDVTLVRERDPAEGLTLLRRGDAHEATGARPARVEMRTTPVARTAPPAAAGSASAVAPMTFAPTAPSRPPAPASSALKRAITAPRTTPLVIPEGSAPVPRPAVAVVATAGADASWADAVKRSSEIAEPPQHDATLRPGDVLDHPKFGRCEVLRVDDGQERVSVRLGNGRLVELGLEVLHLEHLRSEGERAYYRVHTTRR